VKITVKFPIRAGVPVGAEDEEIFFYSTSLSSWTRSAYPKAVDVQHHSFPTLMKSYKNRNDPAPFYFGFNHWVGET